MMPTTDEHPQRRWSSTRRIEQHADGHEEQHGESVAQRQGFLAARCAEFGFAHDHAGEERAERERHAEQFGRTIGEADGGRDHAKGEEFARAGARHLPEQPGNDALADHQHERHEEPIFMTVISSVQNRSGAEIGGRLAAKRAGRAAAATPAPAPWRGPRRSASRRRSGRRSVSSSAVRLHRLQHHDRAGDAERKAEH